MLFQIGEMRKTSRFPQFNHYDLRETVSRTVRQAIGGCIDHIGAWLRLSFPIADARSDPVGLFSLGVRNQVGCRVVDTFGKGPVIPIPEPRVPAVGDLPLEN